MKIWYQSMSTEAAATWRPYVENLHRALDPLKQPGTEIHIAGLKKKAGAGHQYRYLEHLGTNEVLENVNQAVREGYDAFLIANFMEPGLHIAREIADFPVLGLCETSVLVACMMGAKFGVVSLSEKFTPRVTENVQRVGVRDRVADIVRMNIDRIPDIHAAFQPGAMQERVMAEFEAAVRQCTAKGAEVIIPAGGLMMSLLKQLDVQEVDGAPVLDGTIALLKFGEAAVAMNKAMGGRFVSKRLAYAPPSPSEIEAFRRGYGSDIYPTVASTS